MSLIGYIDPPQVLVATTSEARALGLKEYFSGKPCKYGHFGYRKANGGACLTCRHEYRRKHYIENKVEYQLYSKEYVKNHSEWNRARSSRRRAIKNKAGGEYTKEEILKLYSQQQGKCFYCLISFKKTGYDIDHIVPLIRGGSNNMKNIQLLCPTCNRRKGAKLPLDFARCEGRLL